MLQTIFRALRPRRPRHNASSSQKQRLVRAVAEALEQRRLLSVTASLSSGVLTVTGDTADNVIALQTSSGSLSITDHGSAVTGSPVTESSVTSIVVNADAGGDSITINTSVASSIHTTLNGGNGDDVITGGNTPDVINGDAGADSLVGGAGADTLAGGAGNDTINGGNGSDTVSFAGSSDLGTDNLSDSGASTDTDALYFAGITSGAGVVVDIGSTQTAQQVIASQIYLTLASGSAFESVTGTIYADNIFGNDLANTLYGIGGDDDIDGHAGSDYISGGDGHDVITGGDDGDHILGDGGDDNLSGNSGADTINGGDGSDDITGDSENDLLYGDAGSGGTGYVGYGYIAGDGDDTIHGNSGVDTIYGGHGNDSLFGDSEADTIYGDYASLTGSSTVEGDDYLDGGSGNDTLIGDTPYNSGAGYGDDQLIGGLGSDVLYGDTGRGTGYGIIGNDTLDGSEGDDFLYGEDGDDTYRFWPGGSADFGTDTIQENDPAGTDTLDFKNLTPPSGVSGITLNLTTGTQQTVTANQLRLILGTSASVENVVGSDNGDDSITGNSLANVIYGGLGNDTIHAGSGADTLYGGNGNDSLYGEDGDDILYGGDDADGMFGGNGNDTFHSQGDGVVDTLDGGAGTGDTATDRDILANDGLNDSVINIENL
jgi:Ca2+-binding RTX toxin-like protein